MDAHLFDTYIKQHFSFLTRFLPKIMTSEENKIWEEIIQYGKDDPQLLSGLQLINTDNVYDTNCLYRPRELYAQTWKKINYDRDLIELLFNQVKDMVATQGYCPQGRTNRCIQIIMLMDS